MSNREVRSQAPSQAETLALYRTFRRPKVLGLGFLWLLGLYAVFLAPAPVKITNEKLENYSQKLTEAEGMTKALAKAEKRMMDAEFSLKKVSVWFWRWRPEHRAAVERRQPAVDAAKQDLQALRQRRDSILREAKGALGLWSEAGIEEGRDLLWSSFGRGKAIAQRQTFWDSIFQMLSSRDKDWFVILLQLLFTALINYTIGTLISLFSFAISLPSMLWTYSPSWPSAIAFFSVAVVAAASLIATYLVLLYAAGTAVVVTTASFVTRSQMERLGAQQQQTGRSIRYRTHHE